MGVGFGVLAIDTCSSNLVTRSLTSPSRQQCSQSLVYSESSMLGYGA